MNHSWKPWLDSVLYIHCSSCQMEFTICLQFYQQQKKQLQIPFAIQCIYMDIEEREEVGIWCSEDSLQVGPQMTRGGSQDQSALPCPFLSTTHPPPQPTNIQLQEQDIRFAL